MDDRARDEQFRKLLEPSGNAGIAGLLRCARNDGLGLARKSAGLRLSLRGARSATKQSRKSGKERFRNPFVALRPVVARSLRCARNDSRGSSLSIPDVRI